MADKRTQFRITADKSVTTVATDNIVISTIEVDYKMQILDIVCSYEINIPDPENFYGVESQDDWITVVDKGNGKFRLTIKENFNPIVYVTENDGSMTEYNTSRLGRVLFYSYVNEDDVLELDIIQAATKYKVEKDGNPETKTDEGGITTAIYKFNVVGGRERIYIKNIKKIATDSEGNEVAMYYDDDLKIRVDDTNNTITITDFGMIDDTVSSNVKFIFTIAHRDNRQATCEIEYHQTFKGTNTSGVNVKVNDTSSGVNVNNTNTCNVPAKGGNIRIDVEANPQTEWSWSIDETGSQNMYWLNIEEGADALFITIQSFNDTEEDKREATINIYDIENPSTVKQVKIEQSKYEIEEVVSTHAMFMAAAYRRLLDMSITMPPVYTYNNVTLIFDWDGTPVDNDGYIDVETTPNDSMILAESLSYFVKCRTDRHRISFKLERSKSTEGRQGIVRIKNAENMSSALDITIIQLPYRITVKD